MNNQIKVIAFDCDGVLFDTRKANMAYYNHILSYFNMPGLTGEQFDFVQMNTVDESLKYLFKEPSILADAQAFRKKLSYLPFIKDMVIEPTLKSLLSDLGNGYKRAIATNRADTMNRVLKEHDLTGYFDLVVTAHDVTRPKPDPEPLNKILAYFHIMPLQAIYVGDSKLDELAAKGAGIPLVAYNNDSLSAMYHIKSLSQIREII